MLDDRNASTQRPLRWRDGNIWLSLRTLASLLTVVWAGFCAIVIAVDVLDPEASAGLSPAERAAMIGISVFVLGALAAIPRRWEMAGGVLLVLAGLLPWLASLAGLGARPWDLSPDTLLIAGFFLGILPIVAGGLFLLDARTRRWNGPP